MFQARIFSLTARATRPREELRLTCGKPRKGSIDNSGCVSNISAQCGTAAIIASDDCRVTGSKAVTLHGGVGAISISGADAPQNDCYVANNAVGTVQWGITKAR